MESLQSSWGKNPKFQIVKARKPGWSLILKAEQLPHIGLPDDLMDQELPDCIECNHYYITHDVSFPYGCRALDFKSKRKPHLDVLDASNKSCLAFDQRRKKHRSTSDGTL
jgi:hypothetical protein